MTITKMLNIFTFKTVDIGSRKTTTPHRKPNEVEEYKNRKLIEQAGNRSRGSQNGIIL